MSIYANTHRAVIAPTHDFYCRCRNCKPPLVGQTNRFAIKVALIATVCGAWFAGHVLGWIAS